MQQNGIASGMKVQRSRDKRAQRGNRHAVIARILGPHLALAWRTMLLAMMLAVSWQGFVAQTHQHPEGASPFVGGTVLVNIAASADSDAPLKLPDSCPICRELNHAGSALLPVPAEIVPPVLRAALAPETSLASPADIRLASHGWRSRAPPQPLQA